jgi:hypothetical protein
VETPKLAADADSRTIYPMDCKIPANFYSVQLAEMIHYSSKCITMNGKALTRVRLTGIDQLCQAAERNDRLPHPVSLPLISLSLNKPR